ncbi:SDR family oxidoreductase [Saccharomonospora xinjiangensis]|uniref:SDR family oxidoreductase n=1 Tax=Saccharomonospora xinjiangensis TaxID=75294 RepID=UPI001FFD4FAC|nr:NAD(P)H-binding protein [Saccharomonospora xinjiangensis]
MKGTSTMVMVVFGATGNIGRPVAAGLRAAGHEVRVTTRDPGSAAFPPGWDVVAADLLRPETLPAALEGADGVFVYAVEEGAREFARAAEKAGVRHVVLLSSEAVTHEGAEDSPIARQHRAVEIAIEESTLDWTFLRPGLLATNTRWCWQRPIRETDRVRLPYPGAHTAPVHEDDLAALAVTALTRPGHERRAYRVLGPESLTLAEQIQHVAEARGRAITVEHVTPSEARAELGATMPEVAVEAMLAHWAAQDGRRAEVSTVVEEVTGRPGRTFAEWAADHAADFL